MTGVSYAGPGGYRIQALLLHPRFAGHATLERWGLVPGAFGTWDLRRAHTPSDRVVLLARLVSEAVRRERPTVSILGLPRRDNERCRRLRRAAKAVLGRLGVPTIEVSVAVGVRLLVGRGIGRVRGELGESIVEKFFPELRPCLTSRSGRRETDREHARRRYYANAWHAAALAIHHLVQTHPRTAFALSRGDTGHLCREIAAAEARLHPYAYATHDHLPRPRRPRARRT